MLSRKMLMLAVMLTTLFVAMVAPAIAGDSNGSRGIAKNAGVANATENLTLLDPKGIGNKHLATPQAGQKDPAKNATGNGARGDNKGDDDVKGKPEKSGTSLSKLNVSNLPTPIVTGINKTKPGAVTVTQAPENGAQLKAEKVQADRDIKKTLNQIDLYIRWVNNSRLPESDKALLIQNARDNAAWYRQMNGEIQASDSASEVGDLVAEVDSHSSVLKTSLKRDAGLVASDNLDAKIITAAGVSDLVEQRLATLKAQGNDTSKLDTLLSNYDSHVEAASLHADAARAAFISTSAADSAQGLNNGYHELQQAEVELALAYNDLKNLYRTMLSRA